MFHMLFYVLSFLDQKKDWKKNVNMGGAHNQLLQKKSTISMIY